MGFVSVEGPAKKVSVLWGADRAAQLLSLGQETVHRCWEWFSAGNLGANTATPKRNKEHLVVLFLWLVLFFVGWGFLFVWGYGFYFFLLLLLPEVMLQKRLPVKRILLRDFSFSPISPLCFRALAGFLKHLLNIEKVKAGGNSEIKCDWYLITFP